MLTVLANNSNNSNNNDSFNRKTAQLAMLVTKASSNGDHYINVINNKNIHRIKYHNASITKMPNGDGIDTAGSVSMTQGAITTRAKRKTISSTTMKSSASIRSIFLLLLFFIVSLSTTTMTAAASGVATASTYIPGLKFEVQPSDTIVRRFGPAWLHCSVTLTGGREASMNNHPHSSLTLRNAPDTDADATVAWIKDGSVMNLQRDTRRHQLDNNSLFIEAVSVPRGGGGMGDSSGRSDEGLYQCRATVTDLGTILSIPARLSVARLTKFTQNPVDLSAYEGEKAFFSCSVNLDPHHPTPSWGHAHHHGDYWGAAETLGGGRWGTWRGGGGDDSVEVTWHRNDVPLVLDSRMMVLPSGALEISDLVLNDAGKYHCHVTSHSKTKVSDSASLLVLEAYALRDTTAPRFIATPGPKVVNQGQNLTLDCAANGYPEPSIVWLKDGATITVRKGGRWQKLGNSNSIHMTAVRLEDAGSYMCRAENRLDSTDAVAHLTVRVPPRIANPAPPVVVSRPREDVQLQCDIQGVPAPSITWYKNGELILYSEYFQLIGGHDLKILGLVEGDAGMYQCFGRNVAGIVQASTRLLLATPLLQPEENSNSSSTTNNKFSLNYNNNYLTNTDNVNKGDMKLSGNYGNGASSSSGNHGNVALPSTPRNVAVVTASNRYVTLRWEAPEVNNDVVGGYLLYYRRKHSNRERIWTVNALPSSSSVSGITVDEYRTQINQLSPGTTYLIRVAARVATGGDDGTPRDTSMFGDGPETPPLHHVVGDSSDPLEVTTKPDLDLPPVPRNLTVTPVSSTQLGVRWEPPEELGGVAPITGYKLFYMKVGSVQEEHVYLPVVLGLPPPSQHQLHGLQQYTQYSVWLLATNRHGDGNAPREVVARTFSDVPSAIPQNLRVEAASTRSLIIQWEAPPLEHQNGVITGYKIRFRERRGGAGGGGPGGGGTRTPDGSMRLYALNGLKKATGYSVKISALTVNGSGPVSPWIHAATFSNDLDESSVPGKPTALVANPKSTSITIRWNPPSTGAGGSTLVRGYTIGWGPGIPDVYTKIVDASKRRFIIDGLTANSEYVLSVRGFNNIGDGQPVYEQVNTRPPDPEPQHRLRTPFGVKADVMTSFSVALSWTDGTLNSNQFMGDRGYYMVRYTTYASASSSSPRYKYLNVSAVTTCLIDHLKPATMYEFTVKTVKGNRESRWSLVAANTTLEAKPSSPPRDVTVVTIRNQPYTVAFNWQPPRQGNGRITGYLIFYTTDPSLQWGVEQVSGDRLTWGLSSLTPQTTYYYKLQAKNIKGYSPFTTISNFTTLPGGGGPASSPPGGSLFVKESSLLVMIVTAVVTVLLLLVGAVFFVMLYCKRKLPDHAARGGDTCGGGAGANSTGTMKSTKLTEVSQPPDLWIHHDRLELKSLDNHNHHPPHHHHHHHHHGSRTSSPTAMQSTTVLSHADPNDLDDKNTTYTSTSTLDRRTPYHSTYLTGGEALSEDETERLLNRRSFRPKPFHATSPEHVVGGSTSSSVYSDGTLGRSGLVGGGGVPSIPPSHPPVPPPAAAAAAAAAGGGHHYCHDPPYATAGSPLDPLPPPPPPSLLGGMGVMAPSSSSSGLHPLYSESNTLGKQASAGKSSNTPGGPLRSFSTPAPPVHSAPTTPHPKHYGGLHAPSSPFKKLPPSGCPLGPPTAAPPVGGRRVLPPIGRVDSLPEEEDRVGCEMVGGVSTEELSQEMANLEGLMKDLSAITASQFSC
uniref:Neogenin n=2 Tax=Hirondellea gigas TaxID=1518452 RepID=A0A6A7FSF1_9CRUS